MTKPVLIHAFIFGLPLVFAEAAVVFNKVALIRFGAIGMTIRSKLNGRGTSGSGICNTVYHKTCEVFR